MALDAQSNWDVEMSMPLRIPSSQTPRPKHMDKSENTVVLLSKPDAPEVLLPAEILAQIISYIPIRPTSQSMLWSCTLVSRAWYSAAIARLYQRPYLSGNNFEQFVRTVCPSKNAHIRQSALAVLVHRLDMGELVHNASRSLTARILGRLKGNLVEFVAPQSSFAINSFAALSKCSRLRHLDLSLIASSISNKLLFQTIAHLQHLDTLYFPRSASHDPDRSIVPYTWPPQLRVLHLAGGIDDFFLRTHLIHAPQSLQRLSIQHCPQVHAPDLLYMLEVLGAQLQHLTIRHPMSKLPPGSLDYIFTMCPSLVAVRVSADYISDTMFEAIPENHPLRILDLDCSPLAGQDVEVSANAIYEAVEEGRLPDLRSVRVSNRLAWTATERTRSWVRDLEEILEEAEDERPLGIVTGVFPTND
ncbi:hypothetical protein BP6252_05553 [Coleophoma cylindrospora]|uniref:F-box domain-containing protein n=1 Tax=Coleophoma cylindrospora TaxID=1849047 RepID=A0A3D8RU61_9HELO|nr:hypothetical protein BP6252_05553 [Coleophoma cylindrospora]